MRARVVVAAALTVGALAPPAPAADPRTFTVGLTAIATGVWRPTAIAPVKDGTGRLFFTMQVGKVRTYVPGSGLATAPYLDITDRVVLGGGERGLLGIVFHNTFSTNGYFFVSYTRSNGDVIISRFTASPPSSPTVSRTTEKIFLVIPHSLHPNHNGGALAFGPDGYLYATTGDGGGGGDPEQNAQNLGSLSGKVLRIGVNAACGGKPYCVPPTNPFVGVAGARGEIWDYGLRNPWKLSFDRGTGRLFIADVGQNAREEIDMTEKGVGGVNFGWDCFEGTLNVSVQFGGLYCTDPQFSPQPPLYEYDHSNSRCAVIGGHMYRGAAYPIMRGTFLLADWCTGEIFGLGNVGGRWVSARLRDHTASITTFGEDTAGELYVGDSNAVIYRVSAMPK